MPRELTRGQRAAAEKARLRADSKRLTQKDLAEMVGVSEKAVWSFLNGQAWPRPRTLTGYENTLGWVNGYLSRLAEEVDAEVQVLHDAEPGERRLVELVQELRAELDDKPIDRLSGAAQRAVHRLVVQLAGLGAEPDQNVRPLRLRPEEVVVGELRQEREFRGDTLASGAPGARAIAERVHDPKIQALEAELELVRRHGESSVTGS